MDMLACPMARSYVGQFPEGFDDNAPGGSEAAGPSGSQQPSPMQAAIQSALLNVSSIDGLLSLLSQPAQEQESSRSKAMSSLKMSPYNWMFYSAFGGAVPKDTWHTPMELLADVMDKVRRIDRGPLNIQRFPQSLDLNLYVSRRDYENGRLLLMRNLRSMPSLCRFVYHSVLTQVGSQQTSSQTPSFSSPSPGPSTSARTPREVRRRSSTLSVTPRS